MTSPDPLVAAAARAAAALLPAGASPIVARASGRLDVLGGVADYSGGRVLGMPLTSGVAVVASTAGDGRIVGYSTDASCGGGVELSIDDVVGVAPRELSELLRESPASSWASYVLGPLAVAAERIGSWPEIPGLRFLVHADLPAGAGLASSAALEVAALRALTTILDMDVDPEDHAEIAQEAEHVVAGAPCGLMDQATVCHGERGRLLPLTCRPTGGRAIGVEAPVDVPRGWRLIGIPSGVRHAVGGEAYARARVAAFMGRALLEIPEARPWLGACPADALREHLSDLPEDMTGAEFASSSAGPDHGDAATEVQPGVSYPVRAATAHAVLETERVARFLDAIANDDPSAAGRCLDESHASYGDLGLGCPETDAIAESARAAGAFGARVSGGGSGGTVVALAPDGFEVANAVL